jgi:hypothetical protein
LTKAFAPVALSLVCAALMIMAAWWKRNVPAGSQLHTFLEWSIQLFVIFVIVGISVAGVASQHPSHQRQTR